MIYYFRKILCHRLLAWSTASILAGASLWLAGDPFWRGVGLQAVLWGLIDGLIAFLGLRGLAVKLDKTVDPTQADREAARFKRILWINAGLDVLYVTGGLLLVVIWRVSPFLRGSSWGVVIQGGFLLLFDLLHALWVPREVVFPDLGLLQGAEHQPFELPGGRGLALLVHGYPGTPAEIRPWAEALNRCGWTVRGLCLPGFGPYLPQHYQQRAAALAQYVAGEVRGARAENRPLLLGGFSMGGALCMAAAVQEKPDALLLISPFWWDESPLVRVLVAGARLFLPQTIAPFRRMPAALAQLRREARLAAPDANLDDPVLIERLRSLAVPLVLLDQIRRLSALVRRSAGQLDLPVYIIQGKDDTVVRPALTRRLVKMVKSVAAYREVPGEHHMLIPGNPGYEETMQAADALAADALKRSQR